MRRFLRLLITVVVGSGLVWQIHAQDDQAKTRDAEVLTDVSGKPYRLPGPGECQAVVVIFLSHDCPIANAYAPEIKRLCQVYKQRGVVFCVVYAERDLSRETAKKHAQEYGYCCPVLLDPELKLVRRVGATKVPEAAVLSPRGDLLYRGRIDDRYVDYGQRRSVVRSQDLRDALDAALSGKPVARPRTEVIGCDIDFGPTGQHR
ncbi:MAG: redoxin family protein [Gemmatales bacterium]|nr:redoxin family protein [Gemmatales bacterium]MDW8386012.1 redoxin family protein [Gemmatales bacterium]